MQMLEYRCKKCGRLLFKAEIKVGIVEVKCGKCGFVNKIEKNK